MPYMTTLQHLLLNNSRHTHTHTQLLSLEAVKSRPCELLLLNSLFMLDLDEHIITINVSHVTPKLVLSIHINCDTFPTNEFHQCIF